MMIATCRDQPGLVPRECRTLFHERHFLLKTELQDGQEFPNR